MSLSERDAERYSLQAVISPVWEDVPPRDSRAQRRQGPVKSQRDALLRRSLAIADVMGAFVGLFVAITLVRAGSISARASVLLIAPFVLVTSKAIGLYDCDQNRVRKTTVDELPSILYLSLVYTLAIWLAEEWVLDGWLVRPQVFALCASTVIATTLARAAARRLVLKFTPSERCVILGDAEEAAKTTVKLTESSGVKATIVGRVALSGADQGGKGGGETLGSIESIGKVVAEHEIERVIIAPDGHDQDKILHAMRVAKALGAKVSVLPRLLEVVGSSATYDEVNGITLLGVPQDGLSRSSLALKRLMDLAIATTLLIVLAPLLTLVAIAIKLDSRGPVLFKQPRIGRRGRRFGMLKFRSMVADAELLKPQLRDLNEVEGGLFKITKDPRITNVGRFLRRTSIDELPQLLNVICGHMSLVGPRPLVPDEDALIEGWQRRRLAVAPGMTGLWQICGSSRIPMQDMVKIDYHYGANWSIWLDTKILIRTIPYMLKQRGL